MIMNWQLPVMKELSPSVTRDWVWNLGSLSYYPSLQYYLKTLFQTSKQKILSQACSLSPCIMYLKIATMNTGILSMNSFFFLYFETVLINALMMMLIQREKNEENLNEVVKCLYFCLVNYALSGSIGREGLRGVLVSRYISQLQESICKNYQRKNSRFSTIHIWYFVIKCGGTW